MLIVHYLILKIRKVVFVLSSLKKNSCFFILNSFKMKRDEDLHYFLCKRRDVFPLYSLQKEKCCYSIIYFQGKEGLILL